MKRLKIKKVTVEEFEVKAKVGNWFTELKGTKIANAINNRLIQNNEFEYLGILSDGRKYIDINFTSYRDFREGIDEYIIEEVSYSTPLRYYGGDREHQLTFDDLLFRKTTNDLNKMPYITEVEYYNLKSMGYKAHICPDVTNNYWYKTEIDISDLEPIKIGDYYYAFLKPENMKIFDGDEVIPITALQGIKANNKIIWHFATNITAEDIIHYSLDDLEYKSFRINKIREFNN